MRKAFLKQFVSLIRLAQFGLINSEVVVRDLFRESKILNVFHLGTNIVSKQVP